MVVPDDSTVDLPDERDPLSTRADQRFTILRPLVCTGIQNAKNEQATPSPATT